MEVKLAKNLIAVAGILAIMTGCNNNDDNRSAMNDRNDDNVNVENVGYKTDKRTTADLDLADKAADKIKDLKEVERAVVIKTDENAFVAVQLTGNKEGNVTKELEDKVADKVRSVDHDIDNVYVSSNPDFYDRMTNYGQDIENGHPISGLFNEFSETVRRVFPNYR
ncbi:YhcN/YlaJ family sporulation lipoprotein [Niallia sp. 03133]|uniref:YhcN/YlaJ family sporulation lipoprotein n=1 Tax=Niallia sp. 03133 TaxID=3458060 RepID=UPI0040443EA2